MAPTQTVSDGAGHNPEHTDLGTVTGVLREEVS